MIFRPIGKLILKQHNSLFSIFQTLVSQSNIYNLGLVFLVEVHLKQRSLGCQNIDQFLMAVQTLTPTQWLVEMAIFNSLICLIYELLDDLTGIEIWVIHDLRRQSVGREGFSKCLC